MPTASLTAARFWTPATIAAVTEGRWLAEPADDDAPLKGVGIDTRTLASGHIFLAIAGERFDGHNFLAEAQRQGAVLAIVHRPPASLADAHGLPLLLVDDTVAALHRLARAWRGMLAESGCRVVAVAGSNGKTTTRHLVHCVLVSAWRGTQAPGSFNNHLGVPLTLLGAAADDDFVVVEIGTNHPGEVAALADLARPNVGVITSIGPEHMEYFGTLTNVAREEASLLRFVQPGGAAVVCDGGQWPSDVELPTAAGVRLIRFGKSADCGVRVTQPTPLPGGGVTFSLQGPGDAHGMKQVHLPLRGTHNATNAAAAMAVARLLGVNDDRAIAALRDVEPVAGRMQTLRYGQGVTVIHDAYNANPASASAALAELSAASGTRRVAVLGDMFELGEQGPDAHRELGRYVADLGDAVAMAVLIGRLSMFTGEALSRARPPGAVHVFAAFSDELPEQVAALLEPGDTVLLKASRGMRFERLLPAIEQRFGSERETDLR